MLSDKQIRQKQEKIEKVVYFFLNHPSASMEDVSRETNISSSSVQRYLNDPYVEILIGSNIALEIKERLQNNKLLGKQKGGIISTNKHQTPRDNNGKFTSPNKEEQHQIEKIALYGFTRNLTIDELAETFSISNHELKATFNELLPLLNPELYHLIYEQYGLNDEIETSKQSSTGWKRK